MRFPGTQIPAEFPCGEGVCDLLHLFVFLCFHVSYLPCFVSLPLPAADFGSSLEPCAQHSSQTTGLTHDLHLPCSSAAPGPHLGLLGTKILQTYPEGRAVLSCQGGGSPKGLALSHLGEVCLQQLEEVLLEEDFQTLFCPLTQAASPPLPSVSLLCPGGDRPRASGFFWSL